MKGVECVENELIELRETPDMGIGVFVRPGKEIKEGAWIGIYLGEVLTEATSRETSCYLYALGAATIDAGTFGNWTRFLNSHCRPNVQASTQQIGKMTVVAFSTLRMIKGGQQIFISYGPEYFDKERLCICSAKNQGHIPPELPVVEYGSIS